MTFRRSLTRSWAAGLFCGLVGCAAIPGLADDVQCANPNCTTQSDGGVPDGYTIGFDSGYGDGATSNTRSDLCGKPPCNPDDETSCLAKSDAGDAAVPATDAAIESCHMVVTGQQTSPMCEASGLGGDGASCASATDCAPGFECVGGTTGTCQHYCCSDDPCTNMTTASTDGTAYFCDVATELNSKAKVPVCLQVYPCQPLSGAPNQCYSGQTCTIVEVASSSSLVATCDTIGTGGLGDSCETEQCNVGFGCIGQPGLRTCQQLCNQGTPCPGMKNCNMKDPALTLLGVGVCS